MATREWAAGDRFSLADCAAAPFLVLCRLDPSDRHGASERHRVPQAAAARPSFARAVDEARPYRTFFPLGAPDRD
jgi:glutathione S-transferase